MNIYVGNLSFETESSDLEKLFSNYGEVSNVRLMTDRDTGRKRGFAFVDMTSNSEANQAIEQLDNKDFMGRNLKVNQAKERAPQNSRY